MINFLFSSPLFLCLLPVHKSSPVSEACNPDMCTTSETVT